MSDIKRSEKKPTRKEHIYRLLKIQKKLEVYISQDFGPLAEYNKDGTYNTLYPALKNVGNMLQMGMSKLLFSATMANAIEVKTLHQNDVRQSYIDTTLGSIDFIINQLQFAIRNLKIKPGQYLIFIMELKEEREFIQKWSKQNFNLRKNLIKVLS